MNGVPFVLFLELFLSRRFVLLLSLFLSLWFVLFLGLFLSPWFLIFLLFAVVARGYFLTRKASAQYSCLTAVHRHCGHGVLSDFIWQAELYCH